MRPFQLPIRRAGHRTSPSVPDTAGWLRAPWQRVTARGTDHGGATAELAVAMPLLLLLVMFAFQAGVWMHATHVAQAAATRAATTASGYQASAGAGNSAGRDTLTALSNGALKNPSVSVIRTATDVRVEIVGTAQTVVPGVRWTARAVVVRPVERWVPDTGGRP